MWQGWSVAFVEEDFTLLDKHSRIIPINLNTLSQGAQIISEVHIRFRFDKSPQNFTIRKFQKGHSFLCPIDAVVSILLRARILLRHYKERTFGCLSNLTRRPLHLPSIIRYHRRHQSSMRLSIPRQKPLLTNTHQAPGGPLQSSHCGRSAFQCWLHHRTDSRSASMVPSLSQTLPARMHTHDWTTHSGYHQRGLSTLISVVCTVTC